VDLVVGLDVGGTKLAVRAETVDGSPVADITVAAGGWSATPAASAARWISGQLSRCLPGGSRVVAAGIGAQGCDSAAICEDLRLALGALGVPAAVVNDGALLVPAAGLDAGIGIVAGTGSIAVGTDRRGETLLAGGWGWVLGDEGGAAAIVREATRAALAAHDEGLADDGLLAALLGAFGVGASSATAAEDGVAAGGDGAVAAGGWAAAAGGWAAERLARIVNDEPTVENWAPRAAAVFAAAEAGSGRAAAVIEAAAAELAALVRRVRARGAVGTTVVAGGSVVTRQPLLARALADRLRLVDAGFELRVLAEEPVAGAVVLARRLLHGSTLAK
jgi:N-acetylglucosamine kinase-like BadF-type ATPase